MTEQDGRFLKDLWAYLSAVFAEGFAKVLTFFDFLSLVLFLWPQLADRIATRQLTRSIGGTVFVLSFIVANFVVHRRQRQEVRRLKTDIQELGTVGAEAWVKPVHSVLEFCQSYRVDGPKGRLDKHQLDVDTGVPGYACLRVSLKYGNIGEKPGYLVCEIDRQSTVVPPIFEAEFRVQEKGTSRLLRGRKERLEPDIPQSARLMLLLIVREERPEQFAEALKRPGKYRVVLHYHTESSVRGIKGHLGTVSVEGDLTHYRQQVLERWGRSDKFRSLAEIVEN
jgi:hypothetical protein